MQLKLLDDDDDDENISTTNNIPKAHKGKQRQQQVWSRRIIEIYIFAPNLHYLTCTL